jgi:cytidine deaminase
VQMVAAGDRTAVALVVVTRGPIIGTPCGACRQSLAELVDDMPIRLLVEGGAARMTSLGALLPDAFRAEALKG